jgi:hypothetical protein
MPLLRSVLEFHRGQAAEVMRLITRHITVPLDGGHGDVAIRLSFTDGKPTDACRMLQLLGVLPGFYMPHLGTARLRARVCHGFRYRLGQSDLAWTAASRVYQARRNLALRHDERFADICGWWS